MYKYLYIRAEVKIIHTWITLHVMVYLCICIRSEVNPASIAQDCPKTQRAATVVGGIWWWKSMRFYGRTKQIFHCGGRWLFWNLGNVLRHLMLLFGLVWKGHVLSLDLVNVKFRWVDRRTPCVPSGLTCKNRMFTPLYTVFAEYFTWSQLLSFCFSPPNFVPVPNSFLRLFRKASRVDPTSTLKLHLVLWGLRPSVSQCHETCCHVCLCGKTRQHADVLVMSLSFVKHAVLINKCSLMKEGMEGGSHGLRPFWLKSHIGFSPGLSWWPRVAMAALSGTWDDMSRIQSLDDILDSRYRRECGEPSNFRWGLLAQIGGCWLHFQRWRLWRGCGQAALFKRVYVENRAPYTDFSVWIPYERRMSRVQKCRTFMSWGDGLHLQKDLPGPPSHSAWRASWNVYKVACLMLNICSIAALEVYARQMISWSHNGLCAGVGIFSRWHRKSREAWEDKEKAGFGSSTEQAGSNRLGPTKTMVVRLLPVGGRLGLLVWKSPSSCSSLGGVGKQRRTSGSLRDPRRETGYAWAAIWMLRAVEAASVKAKDVVVKVEEKTVRLKASRSRKQTGKELALGELWNAAVCQAAPETARLTWQYRLWMVWTW